MTGWRELPVATAAALAAGLPPDSRTMHAGSGRRVSTTEALLALLVDQVALLRWGMTKDGRKGKNRPRSVLAALTGEEKEKQVQGFRSGEEFEQARNKIIAG